jgi:outer membrane protein TolC
MMMMTKIFVMVFTTLLLYENSAKAQVVKYSLKQCLELAVNNSYEVRRANFDVQEAAFQKQEAQSGVLPQINVSGSADNNLLLPKMMLPGEIIGQPGEQIPVEMGTKYVLDASASLEQVVFSPSLFTGIKIAKNNLELQRLRGTMTKEEIIFNVSYAYYDILNSMQESEHTALMLAKQDSLYILMKRRVEEKVAREVDLNRLQVNRTNLRVRNENIINTIAQQKRYLQILIGIPTGEPIDLDDSAISIIEDTGHSTSLQLEILYKQKDILDLEIKQVKAGYLPTLSAIASGGYQFQAENMSLSKEPWYSSFLIGVRVSIPLFDGFAKRSQIRQKQVQLQRLNTDIEETGQTIGMNYHNAISNLKTTGESLKAQNENLQLAEKVYEQTSMLYKEGLASLTDLLETENSLHEAKTSHTSEMIRYKKAEIDLLKANGTLRNLLEVNNNNHIK